MAPRRLLTIPAVLLGTLIVTTTLPLLFAAALLLTLHPACRGALPTLGFLCGYLWCESIGIVACAYLWLTQREPDEFLEANYRLQRRWASTLKRIAEWLFDLRFHVSGEDALDGEGAIMLPRHASIADTLIPMVYYAIPRRIRLRYVLKRELLLDPCLDIVGHRLPNYFVDRDGQDSDRARAGVASLTANLGADEGVLLYPEGTRSSRTKRSALAARYARNPHMLAQIERWPDLLPPRLGGVQALLAANPGRDLVFCAHVGFEGSSHFATLINGSWRHARIRIGFWRVPYEQIPTGVEARAEFLFGQWDAMQQWVSLHGSDRNHG